MPSTPVTRPWSTGAQLSTKTFSPSSLSGETVTTVSAAIHWKCFLPSAVQKPELGVHVDIGRSDPRQTPDNLAKVPDRQTPDNQLSLAEVPTYLPTCLPTYLPTYLPACLPACLPTPAHLRLPEIHDSGRDESMREGVGQGGRLQKSCLQRQRWNGGVCEKSGTTEYESGEKIVGQESSPCSENTTCSVCKASRESQRQKKR